jgi:phosphoribosylformylglycinamidine cyclo-ligase
MPKKLSYKTAGVDIATADETKQQMAKSLKTKSPLVLNRIGAFASLLEGRFPGYKHPVLVCKTEEPGSKQLLAFQHKRIPGICADLINHLVNDVIVMGAVPFYVQDLIVCGKLEKENVASLVEHISKACQEQGCILTGGETSEQPGVLKPGTYVLGASCIGVVEKDAIIDGSAIEPGDTVLALESSGLHTNGYSLVRALIGEQPKILEERIGNRTFLDTILEPHRCYFGALKDLFPKRIIRGMAHITGGGIPGNLNRILPKGTRAVIDANAITIPSIFRFIRARTGNDDADMLRTFNLGVGMTVVVHPKDVKAVIAHLKKHLIPANPIGTIKTGGSQNVEMQGTLQWLNG